MMALRKLRRVHRACLGGSFGSSRLPPGDQAPTYCVEPCISPTQHASGQQPFEAVGCRTYWPPASALLVRGGRIFGLRKAGIKPPSPKAPHTPCLLSFQSTSLFLASLGVTDISPLPVLDWQSMIAQFPILAVDPASITYNKHIVLQMSPGLANVPGDQVADLLWFLSDAAEAQRSALQSLWADFRSFGHISLPEVDALFRDMKLMDFTGASFGDMDYSSFQSLQHLTKLDELSSGM